ncbi:2-dehydro-3-deoxyphosphogluconate aldolase/(4S)-4-hydroxy-2-oxoglutarate aldolase [Cryobacterium mesophilum]|uniref:Bifunctional 4-hydroxy-2-oxoglutarate aldolase/2-dehydro-3-deoxy-phosphogluconate aldolase n=1 Tax=Terrimesophilobacter mesophilus TaxID=433647 RepID=A0A4R8VC50_9MICO|nr:bifunctional 4-hydroxy-2-oxoglutarate aldolase/2-dehydro-3-deoxy-phosphogluconate aldolase [Terrimesophilobacter mesophilus]MBB5633706.1 2-dehydro-3-deoxyphosphogluconate aldolase/(4S)-4-hydroxy-2-oxoglutarate aldolase [Terrimesophilobacter mesophilus]TFB80393.1 bifunctional 4-hydroxy-2-oxoglutarate aldolase/2-dehydro-3-deoxy-phosphogluconate aldolase [Terrimesophilobacter mesophilus]
MTSPITRTDPSATLRDTPIIAVLRAKDAADYGPVVDTLAENGIRSIELTLSTPNTIELLPRLDAHAGPGIEIGVGTITDLDQAQRAIDAGAAYLVTPVVNVEVIALALRHGLPVYPGGLTPTELQSAWQAGATAVKIFPAETVGPQYGNHLRGPFPELRFVPSGGVLLDDVPAWLSAGATAVSLGGPLIGDALSGGSLEALAERAARVVALARTQRSQA